MRNMMTIFTPNGNNSQKIATSAAAASSNALTDQCYAVELYATQDCWVSFENKVDKTGTVAGAVTSGLSMFIKGAAPPRQYAINSKAVIQAIRDSADGILFVTELTSC